MATGIITEFNAEKGFGFVREDQTGRMIRFNTDEIPAEISSNARVRFTVIDLDPGSLAVNLYSLDLSENNDGFAA
jgi:cold shock CspA family protein